MLPGRRGRVRLGAAAGWMAPGLLKSAQAADSAGDERAPAAMAPQDPIPLGTAPNYRAIVAQNRDSVVGITIDGRDEGLRPSSSSALQSVRRRR